MRVCACACACACVQTHAHMRVHTHPFFVSMSHSDPKPGSAYAIPFLSAAVELAYASAHEIRQAFEVGHRHVLPNPKP